jgi:FO synthase
MIEQQILLANLQGGELPDRDQALALADVADTPALAAIAGAWRDRGHRNTISYSRKVFIPLTHLCRDVCHYCTFARTHACRGSAGTVPAGRCHGLPGGPVHPG